MQAAIVGQRAKCLWSQNAAVETIPAYKCPVLFSAASSSPSHHSAVAAAASLLLLLLLLQRVVSPAVFPPNWARFRFYAREFNVSHALMLMYFVLIVIDFNCFTGECCY